MTKNQKLKVKKKYSGMNFLSKYFVNDYGGHCQLVPKNFRLKYRLKFSN